MSVSRRIGIWSFATGCVLSPCLGRASTTFGNRLISAEVTTNVQHLSIANVTDLRSHASLHPGEAFVLQLDGGREVRSSEMVVSGLKISNIAAIPGVSRASARIAGRQLCVDLKDPETDTTAHWCLIARGDVGYPGRGGALVANTRRGSSRYALGRRRSGPWPGVRMGLVARESRHPGAAQPVVERAEFQRGCAVRVRATR